MSSRPTSRVLVAALLASACGGWERLPDLSPDTLPPRQQVQLWSGGQVRVLHSVQIDGDSIRGVPFQLSPACDSCRVAIPLAAVDSLRAGDQETPAIALIGSGLLVFLLLVHMLSHLGDGT